MKKIFIENSRFLEFKSEIAEMLTKERIPENNTRFDPDDNTEYWTDEAQEVFDGFSDDVEALMNGILEIYDDFGNQQETTE